MKLLLIEAYDILTSNKSVEYNMNTGINSYVTITNRNIQRSDQQQIISLVEYNMNLQSISYLAIIYRKIRRSDQ